MKRFETNFLLTVSRFAEHFYPLVYDLSGRDAIYRNPGSSVRSFVLSGTNILQEFIDVPEEIIDSAYECLEFCNNEAVIKKVMEALAMQPYDVIEKILCITKDSLTTDPMMRRLKTLNEKVQDDWEKMKEPQSGIKPVDGILFTDAGTEFKQSLYDLKAYASELVEALESIEGRKA